MYLALYRKYRPKKFDEIIGQDHIIRTLKNQIAMDKVGHAYLFCGSRGTGKTSTAQTFARVINCTCGGKGECVFCKNQPTLDILEIDAASNNGVDEIRDLREKVKYPPVDGKYKFYIIDEVHMLSPSAFNALLKTLEEPPKHAVFILATTEVHKLPATILSRCMRFDFKLVSVEDLSALLKKVFNSEGITYDEQSVALIARAGEGSVRDTLSIADRCVSFCGDELTHQKVVEVLGATERQNLITLSSAMLGGTVGDALAELDKLLSGGKSPQVLAKDMVYYFRDLLIINTLGEASKNMIIASPTDLEMMRAQATNFNYSKIAKAIDLLSGVEADLRYSVQPRIVLETCIIRFFAQKSLEERVAELEKLLAGEARVQQNPQFRQNAAEHSKAVAVPNIPNTAPTQNLQNVAENSANYAQNAANLAQKQEKSESAKPTFGNAISENQKLLGELLGYLRDQKLMSLLMACRQIYKIAVDGAVARLFVKDASSVSVITSAKYKPILSEFMDNHGLKWEVVGLDGSGNVSELAGKLEGRLEIK